MHLKLDSSGSIDDGDVDTCQCQLGSQRHSRGAASGDQYCVVGHRTNASAGVKAGD